MPVRILQMKKNGSTTQLHRIAVERVNILWEDYKDRENRFKKRQDEEKQKQALDDQLSPEKLEHLQNK